MVLLAADTGRSETSASMTIDVNHPGAVVSSNLFGIFFEEINYGGDGGLYAELVRNRSFSSSAVPESWSLVSPATAGWQPVSGFWSVDTNASPAAYRQGANGTDCRSTYFEPGSTNWNNYTLTLQARKLGGSEGFLIMFNVKDSHNWFWWNLGGWGNTANGIQQSVNGNVTLLTQASGSVNTGQWYDIKVTIQGGTINCYLDNVLTQTFATGTSYAGTIGLSTWNTQSEFRNIVVSNSVSGILYQSDFQPAGSAAGTISVDTTNPLNTNNVNSLKLTMDSGTGSVGLANYGYWGIPLQSNATYDVSLYARATNGFSWPVNVRLESLDGSNVYAQTSFGGLTTNWQHFAAALVSSNTDTSARLVLSISNVGTVWLDEVSLFPRDTYAGRTNGLRMDLANKLADLHPSFYRYPGGNFIESTTVSNAVRWKKTIGPIEDRPGHMNDAWGYWSTDGYGLDEFFRQCEDMHMEPLYGINAGLMLGYNGSANNTVPLNQMGPWVQDALDLIQYANGDTNTTWGAVRAANGHPAPYNLKYMEIGNENGGSYYNERYTLFYDAIKASYPDIHLIAPVWGGIPWSRPVEIMDEHYYSSPATFMSYATKYDNYDRNGPKVFVGEYAVTSGYGTYGNLAAGLGEAAFMTGIERNSDLVKMACYAPLFANVNGTQWHPDLINFDNHRSFGTPAYYVQQMFSQNRGEAVLPNALSQSSQNVGAVGLGTWNTAASYTNLVVTNSGGILYQSDFVSNGTNGWNVFNGTWNTNNGVYQQTAITTDCRSWTGSTTWSNCTYTLRARKDGGSEGFLIIFDWRDSNNFLWWNIGGWNNTSNAVQYVQNGSWTVLATTPGSVTNGGWYDIRVELTSSNIRCYLNNVLIHDIPNPASSTSLYASTTYSKSAGQVIVKAVNPSAGPVATTINLGGVSSVATNATLIQLASGSSADENSLADPTNVYPQTTQVDYAGKNFTITLPAYSLSVLRLNVSGINTYSTLLLTVPSPIGAGGQKVASTVWGEMSGGWSNLTGNASHAITWSSSDPDIASVDAYGNVAGLRAGATTITATYGALDLSASQAVQVTNGPSAKLVHRYSFSETSGTNVADSLGGTNWDGWLPNGGTWLGGRLALVTNATKSMSQYVRLPAGIVSNYTAVTIDAWASFDTLPGACFFFAFGDISGSTGYNYIFCQPKNGRIAITDGNYSSEQNAYGNFDCSSQTNLHLTAVFNPPIGTILLYTNGVLAAVNSSVTIPMSSVNDVYSFIGRSLYSGDAYFDFNLDEFRIYDGAMTPDDIAASQVLGPDQVLSTASPTMSVSMAGGSLTLSWPLASSSYTVYTTTNLVGGIWKPVSTVPQIFGNMWRVSLPMSDSERFYRLQQ